MAKHGYKNRIRVILADLNIASTKIGCEISFNKFFYRPAPMRTLEENERDILELDEQED